MLVKGLFGIMVTIRDVEVTLGMRRCPGEGGALRLPANIHSTAVLTWSFVLLNADLY